MDRSNVYLNSQKSCGGVSMNKGYDFHQRQVVQQRAQVEVNDNGSGQETIQTEHRGRSFFNFYFQNPGTYKLNISWSRFQGFGSQQSEPEQTPLHSNAATTQASSELLSTVTMLSSQTGHANHTLQMHTDQGSANAAPTQSVQSQGTPLEVETFMSPVGTSRPNVPTKKKTISA